jgi:hypothetical protein
MYKICSVGKIIFKRRIFFKFFCFNFWSALFKTASSAAPQIPLWMLELKLGDFLDFISFHVLYSTLLDLPPLRFYCVGGCWDWTRTVTTLRWQSDALTIFGQNLSTTWLNLINNWAISHPLLGNILWMRSSWEVRASDCKYQNTKVVKVQGSISQSSNTMESEGRQMKQCWILYLKITPP